MAPRLAVRRDRDNVDYSAIGTHGRRTGVTLEQRPLDVNGMEEITGIFSSPRKPSPLKQVTLSQNAEEPSETPESVDKSEMMSAIATPSIVQSARRSLRGSAIRPPRSSSPRKSGISGTARKSNGVDIFASHKVVPSEDPEDRENTPTATPTRVVEPSRRASSPEKSPLRDITPNAARSQPRASLNPHEHSPSEIAASLEYDEPNLYQEAVKEVEATAPQIEHFGAVMDDDYMEDFTHGNESNDERSEIQQFEGVGTPATESRQSAVGQFSENSQSIAPAQNQANSRRKRKSETIDRGADGSSSPTPAKTRKTNKKTPPKQKTRSPAQAAPMAISAEVRRTQALRNKDTNIQMSVQQSKELEEVIDRVRARPGPARSLYILRRETPADEGMTHTRSGRVSVKPLAYWRNERCVYGGTPGRPSLKDGARFPLNSIKEIVRTEEIVQPSTRRGPNKGRKPKRTNKKARATSVDDSEASEAEQDLSPQEDPEAESWERENGTLRGTVSMWDQVEQAPLDQEEEVEIAHAPAAIITREVKGSAFHEGPTFKYAKLLSTSFFGTGIVELPPGGVKRPKNSRKMHMGFFVVKGRVTVQIGPAGGQEAGESNRFSIGKGGFWQVPRGNQYSIENELDRPARIFFSQACEPLPAAEEEE